MIGTAPIPAELKYCGQTRTATAGLTPPIRRAGTYVWKKASRHQFVFVLITIKEYDPIWGVDPICQYRDPVNHDFQRRYQRYRRLLANLGGARTANEVLIQGNINVTSTV